MQKQDIFARLMHVNYELKVSVTYLSDPMNQTCSVVSHLSMMLGRIRPTY